MRDSDTSDVIVIGAGAAGLATAIFAARAASRLRIHCLDGARHVGAKILVSGGSRCNVTNRVVTERDFWGGPSRVVRHVLRAFPPARAVAFFEGLGVPLQEEEDGKLFPVTNRSRTVLEALLAEAGRLGIAVEPGQRVVNVRGDPGTSGPIASDGVDVPAAFEVDIADGRRRAARCVVLATGGRSLPKTGSDGLGYELARRLGHGHVDTTPALVALVLEGDRHTRLSGVSHVAGLTLRVNGRAVIRIEGPLLWTHTGVSGPVALNLSRHWHRTQLTGGAISVHMNACPSETFESLERWWLDRERERPRARLVTVLGERVPAAVAEVLVAGAGIAADVKMSHAPRDARRRLLHALLDTPLEVRDSRGYAFAEVTAGGVPLSEIDPATMASRVCPGLYLVGEVLDVDGRLGGFNFQWAWSSGWVAGQAIGKNALSLP
jgi:predicted Rossmann fold flavoprotein